jgi:hypothetical protein
VVKTSALDRGKHLECARTMKPVQMTRIALERFRAVAMTLVPLAWHPRRGAWRYDANAQLLFCWHSIGVVD